MSIAKKKDFQKFFIQPMRRFNPEIDEILSVEQCRRFDSWAIDSAGIAGIVLMENAARGCAEGIIEKYRPKQGGKVCIFCGSGNNGGDGFAIARWLVNYKLNPLILVCGEKGKIKGDAKANYDIAARMNIPIVELAGDSIETKIDSLAGESCLIVDAIFGTGFKGILTGVYERVVKKINSLDKPVIAVDCPSGLDCDSGIVRGQAAVQADITITFAAAKKGFLNPASREYTGEIYIASIGIEP